MPQTAKQNDLLADWADALASMGQAVMLFDEYQNMAMATPEARRLLAGFWSVEQWAKLHLPDITDLCFDHAIEDSGPNGLTTSILSTFGAVDSGFSEIITCPNESTILIQIVGFKQTGTIVLIKDISVYADWYRNTKTVDEQRDMLLTAIEMTTNGLALFDPSHSRHSVLFVNQAMTRIMGKSRDEILGQSFESLVPECKMDGPECTFQRHLADRTLTYRAQISIVENLGIIFISDITEAHDKEEQIRHMQKVESIGKLAGGVAHDFNNILGIIKGYGHLLAAQFKSNPEASDALDRMMNACNRGAALAEQLLTISRKNRVKPNQSCSVERVLDTLQKMMLPLLPHEVLLKIEPPIPHLQVLMPEDQLHQILMNLILNARDAMPMGGVITIHALLPTPDPPPHATITVEDTGSGMSPEVMSRIFEPFFTTKDLGKGTGLGLAVTYGIIQQYGGTIDVDSTMGLGTKFTLTLPAKIEKVTFAEQSIGPKGEADFTGKTIMVVEDESDLRQPVVTFLSQKNATVIEAPDGNTALALQDEMSDQPIDLLLSDIRMPGGLYGDDLARLWRQIRPESKIILMSGYSEGRDLNDGCTDGFLPKPVDFNDLSDTIYELLSSSKNGS